MANKKDEHPSVVRFQEYLRIPTVHPNPNYEPAIDWLRKQAEEIPLDFHIKDLSCEKGEFAVWLTWKGTNDSLPSILLNSHIDVVPVDESKWTYPPFGAIKAENGNIYARGAQDMKCVGVQYLEAIRNLKKTGFKPLRTVHVSFVPDEEVGGYKGMGAFVKTSEFKNLRVGFALDEGIANLEDSFHLFYGERAIWQFRVTAKGKTGHASILHEDTAAEKLHKVINKLLGLRESEKARLTANRVQDLGDVTSVNMTMLGGGLQANVVPPELSAVFDIRITPHWSLDYLKKMLDDLCKEAGPDVSYEYLQYSNITEKTAVDDSNEWWPVFKGALDSMDLPINQKIFPAATDIRYLRQLKIPAFGFSPMNKTPVLLHDHDEYLHEDVYLHGITIYETILKQITSYPGRPANANIN